LRTNTSGSQPSAPRPPRGTDAPAPADEPMMSGHEAPVPGCRRPAPAARAREYRACVRVACAVGRVGTTRLSTADALPPRAPDRGPARRRPRARARRPPTPCRLRRPTACALRYRTGYYGARPARRLAPTRSRYGVGLRGSGRHRQRSPPRAAARAGHNPHSKLVSSQSTTPVRPVFQIRTHG